MAKILDLRCETMRRTINRMVSGLLCLAMVLCIIPMLGNQVNALNGYDRGYGGGMAGDGVIYAHGLDVSAWQGTGLDFQNIANAGYDYVILRCGTSVRKDACFEEYYANAKAAGLDVGCYYYSYALTVAEAQAEAYDVLSWLEGKVFEYPIYFDFEDPTQVNLDYTLSAQICRGFMDILKDNGYLAGIYSMSWILSRDWIASSGIRGTYEGWVAHVYSEADNTGITSGEYNIYKDRYSSVYGMHQYSFTTYVNGVGPFDANVSYKDYPTIVKKYGFNGYPANNWKRDSVGWWYEYDDGSYAVGWAHIDNEWYYFSQSGYMYTGWLYDEGYEAWFFMDPTTGIMRTGWVYSEGYHYYMDSSGRMLTGWQMIDGNWYYLNTTEYWPEGAMFTGFHEIDGKMYYFNELSTGIWGAMLTGWVQVDNSWYYFNPDGGAMMCGWQKIDGKWYHLDEETGVMSSKEWIYDDGVWYYVNASGAMTEGAEWNGTFENGLDIGTGFYATIDIPLTGTRAGVDSDPNSATYQNVEVQAVRAEDAADYNEQLWYFERRDEDGSYRITNVATGMVMDQVGGYVDKGTNVRVCPNYDSLAQRWFVYANGDHYGFVTACSAWDMTVLDIADGLGDEGTNIRIWSNNGSGAQQFAVTPITEPVTVTAKGFSLSFEDEILVNLYYTVSDLTNVAEHGMLVFYSDPDTVDYSKADAVYNAPVYDSAKDRYMATTDGVAAKEMGDTRYYVVYAKLESGSFVYSNAYEYSPKKYSMNMLGKTSTSDKQKALCVAMLNYGAAAQEYFGYNTDSLMNAELTAQQQALVAAYDKTLFTGAVAADPNKIGAFAATSGFSKKSATVSFESAFCVNYYFTPNATVNGDMTLYIWMPEAYAAAETLTADNAETMTMVAGSNGSYWGQVIGIAPRNLDDTYYVAGVYTDESGNTCCTGVIAYSLSRYCISKAVDGNEMQELASAAAMYGYYAKQYFTT